MIKVTNRADRAKVKFGSETFNVMRGSSPLGNPYKINHLVNRETAIKKYRDRLWKLIQADNNEIMDELEKIKHAVLHGRDVSLECCCHPQKCHADVIKKCIEWMVSKHINNFSSK